MCLSLFGPTVVASELRFSVAEIERGDWSVTGLEVSADLARGLLSLQADSLSHPAFGETLESIQLSCRGASFDGRRYACPSGTVSFVHPLLDAQPASLELSGDLLDGRHEVRVSGAEIFGGNAAISLTVADGEWRAAGQGTNLAAEQVRQALLAHVQELHALRADALIDLQVDLEGSDESVRAGSANVAIRNGSLDGLDGRLGVAALDAAVSLAWRGVEQGTGFDMDVGIRSGEIYIDPIYVEASSDRSMSLSASGWRSQGELVMDRVRVQQAGAGELGGSLTISLPEGNIRRARLTLAEGELAALYPAFLESYLDPEGNAQLRASGAIEAELSVDDGRPTALTVAIRNANLTSDGPGLSASGLRAEVDWSANGGPRPARIGWEAATLYRIPLGGASFQGEALPKGFRLGRATHIPVLDGEFVLESLDIRFDETLTGRMGSRVSGVDLSRLSGVLGWPEMSGEVTAMAPSVKLEDDVVTVQGAVLVRAFSGTLTATGLRLESALGPAPVLHGDVVLRNLDLHDLTRTFSFGNIQGLVDGEIRGLELVNWSPRRFDAYLGTPDGFGGRRRISQNAVEELASVGGGPTARLSQGMLGLFEEFPYRRLGIGCKLQAGICTMRGVAPAKRGYYLVEGRGLPRIDVVGFVDHVDWDVLLARLVAATQGGPPVMK